MIFKLHIPKYPLNLFIESFIYYKDYNPVHSVDRFLPDGNINVVIDLTDYPKFIYDNHTLKEIQACRNVWFSGIRSRYITIPSGRDSEMFIINFHKGMAYPFVEMPLNELTDYVIDGELVLTNKILNLREKLLGISDIDNKFRYTEKILIKTFGSRLKMNPFINFAVTAITNAPEKSALNEIVNNCGYSQKHLIKIFKEHVGLTPNAFLKVIRFQKAVNSISKGKFTDWSSVAYDCGYYDQAHFINDFKQFSGFTPREYTQQKSEFTNYIAVG